MTKKLAQMVPLFCIFGGLSLSGCAITEIPPKTTVERELPLTRTSIISAQAQFPLSKIGEILETSLPVSNRFRGRENGACKAEVDLGGVIGVSLKVGDIKWEVSYTRTSFKIFNATNEKIAANSVFKIHAKVICVVEVANTKVFEVQESTDPDGMLDLTVTMGASIGELYSLESNLGHDCCRWKRVPAFKAVFDLVTVTIETIATDGLKKALDQTARDARGEFNKIALREPASNLWNALHGPIQLHEPSNTSIESRPLSLHASGLQTSETLAKITIAARSNLRIRVGQKPEPADLVALPILIKDVPSDTFGLYVPIELAYETLEKLLTQHLKGKVISVEEGSVQLDGFSIYQSDEKLAVGVEFLANPKNFFPVRGILYFSGTPSVNKDGSFLEFPDLDYSANFNNPIYYLIDWMFHEEFKKKLRMAIRLDLEPEIQKWRSQLASLDEVEVAPSMRFRGRLDNFALDYLVPDADKLAIRLSATGEASVNVDLGAP